MKITKSHLKQIIKEELEKAGWGRRAAGALGLAKSKEQPVFQRAEELAGWARDMLEKGEAHKARIGLPKFDELSQLAHDLTRAKSAHFPNKDDHKRARTLGRELRDLRAELSFEKGPHRRGAERASEERFDKAQSDYSARWEKESKEAEEERLASNRRKALRKHKSPEETYRRKVERDPFYGLE